MHRELEEWVDVAALSPASKLVLDLNTGVFYDSVKEAAAATSRDYKYLCDKLRGRYDNNTPLRYV